MSQGRQKPPRHLSRKSRRFFEWAVNAYEFEVHHIGMLVLLCEHMDRNDAARQAITDNGLTFVDRYGQPRSRPEVQIARDSTIVAARLQRELRLDVEPDSPRPSGLNGGRQHAS